MNRKDLVALVYALSGAAALVYALSGAAALIASVMARGQIGVPEQPIKAIGYGVLASGRLAARVGSAKSPRCDSIVGDFLYAATGYEGKQTKSAGYSPAPQLSAKPLTANGAMVRKAGRLDTAILRACGKCFQRL